MPLHNFQQPRGTLIHHELDSPALAANLVGDPARRTVAVYLPEGHKNSAEHYPMFVYLAAYGGSGLKKLSWRLFGESLPQRIDRLVDEGRMGPMIAVMPDCFTSLGGNQYIDSPVLGSWESFLIHELVPDMESRFRVLPGPPHRAIVGYSSGGYGALIQGLRHGDRWGALACHSGDIGFELLFRSEFPRVLNELARHEGGIPDFMRAFHAGNKVGTEKLNTLMILAMAASFDPEPESFPRIRLPVDPFTCELDPDRWANWLKNDPLELVQEEACLQRLRNLKMIYFDCGTRDQYNLQYGARQLSRRLRELGISHLYEEFEDNHNDIDYRLDRSLPLLYQAIRD